MMGIFSKDSPVEKKLKELTGSFLLSSDFIELLKSKNLEINDGFEIKNQLKEEIKQGLVNENNLQARLNNLIEEYSKKSNPHSQKNKKCPKCNKVQDDSNIFCIYCGFKFGEDAKTCPVCGKKQDFQHEFCIECGHDFSNKKDYKTCPICEEKLTPKADTCQYCHYDFTTSKAPKYLKKCPICFKLQDAQNKTCFKCNHDLTHVDYESSDDLQECPQCGHSFPTDLDICPFCDFNSNEEIIFQADSDYQKEFIRKTQFLNTYDFNLKICPKCNTKFLKADPFCFNCGTSVVSSDTVKNENFQIKDGKLVKNNNSTSNEELSDLEALYSQAVQSKYSPEFKVAYVLYLKNFTNNPNRKFSDKLTKKYKTTENKLKKQAIEDDFIEIASPLSGAKDFKVTELKEILKQHNLKVSGKKDELIERLRENLDESELKKYFKSKNYQISSKGEEFLAKNNYILYIVGNKDISNVFYPAEIFKIFEEKEYSHDEIYDKLLAYLKRILDDKLTQELWVDFKSYSNAIAQIQEDKGDLKEALNNRFKVFLFDINNYSVVLNKPDPRKIKLKQKDFVNLVNLMHKLTLPIDELKVLFENSFNEVLFKTVITNQDSLIYLLKIFGGEDLDNVSKEITESYSNPY